MFFWTHTHQEDLKLVGSKTNQAEASLVIAFTGFLIKNGIDPQKITILAAYLGQVRLIRSQLLTMGKSETLPTVQTVDRFQGDENDVIQINSQGNVGFLNSINRRCMLQYRARCGFYLIGNEKMLVQGHAAKLWKPLLGKVDFSLTDLDALDPQFFTVQDQVTKYAKAMHNWSPVTTRIQLVTNLKREIAYERIKSSGLGILVMPRSDVPWNLRFS
ncbi:hypothetical protein TCAL_05262 [Tigriopus californicus]|uniref:DNA2/NAM7 helicase-like C-terminal domain-containing protein n=1 Tax=Tigriopus californicus TaxID=6832 RepID=A0A553NR74_TIGCA|nr:hypothetical protein TCAL_05262 [Tigriopus californicus]|eukprot:TCALIF_05262-PA protein Name:"Similar to hrr1 Helicase required for RNAi-mediated heterochromatin assembly 1 (Schizosaccharomyces pombe (strain 972 / ATCC 24843))" AED:0.47 eAED:0.48 QI:0/0/0/0.5/1/1/2/0/215